MKKTKKKDQIEHLKSVCGKRQMVMFSHLYKHKDNIKYTHYFWFVKLTSINQPKIGQIGEREETAAKV
jgi:hypothetical protein